MEKLRALFGTEALTWEQLEEKLKDNKEVKLANLASGNYVDKTKYDSKVTELTTLQGTVDGLRETVAKFDGIDVEKLKQDAKDWEKKYNTDLATAKLNSAVDLELVARKAKNPKLAKAALDMSIIKLDGETLIGLSEQLDKLKESDGYLFEEESAAGGGTGGASMSTGGSHTGSGNTDTFLTALMQGAGLEN
jgi:hypothetical protein